MKQKVTSAETSRPQVSRGIKLALESAMPWMQYILDFGCGKYTLAEHVVREAGHVYLPYDPYNRDEATNRWSICNAVKHCDIIVCSNVLNVLDSPHLVHSVIAQIELIATKNTQVIFTVWEGDRSGRGKYTKNGFQANQKLNFYLLYIKEHFNIAEIHNNAIYATK